VTYLQAVLSLRAITISAIAALGNIVDSGPSARIVAGLTEADKEAVTEKTPSKAPAGSVVVVCAPDVASSECTALKRVVPDAFSKGSPPLRILPVADLLPAPVTVSVSHRHFVLQASYTRSIDDSLGISSIEMQGQYSRGGNANLDHLPRSILDFCMQVRIALWNEKIYADEYQKNHVELVLNGQDSVEISLIVSPQVSIRSILVDGNFLTPRDGSFGENWEKAKKQYLVPKSPRHSKKGPKQ
jgi:hypothetical protein